MRKNLVILSFTLATLLPVLTFAQAPAPAPAPTDAAADGYTKTGWNGGLSLGYGGQSVECQDCDGSLSSVSFDLRLGYMISPRLAVVLDSWALSGSDDIVTVTHNIATIGARYWFQPRWWVQGGLGGSTLSVKVEGLGEGSSATKAAIMGAVGYEIYQGDSFVLDAQFKWGAGFQDPTFYNSAINLGCSWY